MRTTVTTLAKTDHLLDKLAIKFVSDGLTPEQILAKLKEANYEVNFTSKGLCKVDAITVANIARGIIIGKALVPAKAKRATAKSKSAPVEA